MSDLMSNISEDGLRQFWMYEITVDGIPSEKLNKYGGFFFNQKEDFYPFEALSENPEGYIDDTVPGFNVFWEGQYSPHPYALGEIDEELWMREGIITHKYE